MEYVSDRKQANLAKALKGVVGLCEKAQDVAKARSTEAEASVDEILREINRATDARMKERHGSGSRVIRAEQMLRFIATKRGSALLRELQAIADAEPRFISEQDTGSARAAARRAQKGAETLEAQLEKARPTSSAVMKSLEARAQKIKRPDETDEQALARLLKARPELYDRYDWALERDAARATWPPVSEPVAKSEPSPAEAELEAKALELRRQDPLLTIEQAKARILKSDAALYHAVEYGE